MVGVPASAGLAKPNEFPPEGGTPSGDLSIRGFDYRPRPGSVRTEMFTAVDGGKWPSRSSPPLRRKLLPRRSLMGSLVSKSRPQNQKRHREPDERIAPSERSSQPGWRYRVGRLLQSIRLFIPPIRHPLRVTGRWVSDNRC